MLRAALMTLSFSAFDEMFAHIQFFDFIFRIPVWVAFFLGVAFVDAGLLSSYVLEVRSIGIFVMTTQGLIVAYSLYTYVRYIRGQKALKTTHLE